MDPQYEQRLRDEVIYLHSLWHQGPPRATISSPAARHHLNPSKPTQFKKEKRRKRRNGKASQNQPNTAAAESNSSPGAEWPCPTPPPPVSTSGWPSLEAKRDPKPLPISPEEQLKLAGKHAHQQAFKIVQEFFSSNNDDDSDAIDSSSEEDDDLMDQDYGRDQYSFFFKVFKEDVDLTDYYEKNFAEGEFSCLVCGALGGKKMGKKYRSCLALIQHSITIAKTKRKSAHRAFGQAICKVLGWDINQLPTIASLLSDKSGEAQRNSNNDNKESSRTSVSNVGSVEDDTVEDKNDNAVQESGPVDTGFLPSGKGDMNSLTCLDAGKNLEDTGMVHPHKAEEPAAEGVVSSSSACPDVDENFKNIDMVYPYNKEEPAPEGLAINSLTSPDADKNLDNFEMVHPHNVEELALEGLVTDSSVCPGADKNLENLGMVDPLKVEEREPELISVPLHENISVGNEMQDLQMDNTLIPALNKDDQNLKTET